MLCCAGNDAECEWCDEWLLLEVNDDYQFEVPVLKLRSFLSRAGNIRRTPHGVPNPEGLQKLAGG